LQVSDILPLILKEEHIAQLQDLFKNAWHKKVSITQWSKPDNTEDDSAFMPEKKVG